MNEEAGCDENLVSIYYAYIITSAEAWGDFLISNA